MVYHDRFLFLVFPLTTFASGGMGTLFKPFYFNMDVKTQYVSTNITAAAPTTTVIATGNGVLHSITFNGPAATGVVTVYNNTAASGTKLATITTPASPQPNTLIYDMAFGIGLTITTATAAQDITVTWSQG